MHDAISRPSHRAVLPNQIGRREWAVEHGDLADRALEVGVAGQRADRERSRPWAGHDFELRERHAAAQPHQMRALAAQLGAIGDPGYALAEKALKVAEQEADRKP